MQRVELPRVKVWAIMGLWDEQCSGARLSTIKVKEPKPLCEALAVHELHRGGTVRRGLLSDE